MNIRMKLTSLNFTVLIGQDEDGMHIAKVPDIQGCYTQGKTVEQAMERIKEAIQVCLEVDQAFLSKDMKSWSRKSDCAPLDS